MVYYKKPSLTPEERVQKISTLLRSQDAKDRDEGGKLFYEWTKIGVFDRRTFLEILVKVSEEQ